MKNSKQNSKTDYNMAHVLYQKLGTDWYAFTEVDGDCYMTKVDAEEAEAKIMQQNNAANSTQRKAA